MIRRVVSVLAVFALSGVAASAQKFEFALLGGGSFTTKKTVSSSRASGEAGFKSGFSGGIGLVQNMYDRVGGELRYTYQKHDLRLTSGGTDVTFGGESHLVHYDLLFYGSPRGSRVRPYVAGGGGIKLFRGTGKEQAFQPLGNLAILTKTSQALGMISVGGGVKFELTKKIQFRVDVHDYITPMPEDVIAPIPGNTMGGGWIHNIVPMAGIAFTF